MKDTTFSDKLRIIAGQRTKERDYWLEKLSGELEKCHFPYDYKKTGESGRISEVVNDTFPQTLSSALLKLSTGSDVKLHIILTAALTLLLGKYTGKQDIIIGTPILRPGTGHEGDFANTVIAFRNRITDDMAFKELLYDARQTYGEAVANQYYPIEILIEELGLTFRDGDFPLFDLAVVVENIQEKSHIDHVKPGMIFSFSRSGEAIDFSLGYDSCLYDRSTGERIMNHFKELLRAVLADVEIKLPAVDILSEEEKRQLLVEFNDTETPYPEDKTIQTLFEEQVEKNPDRTALLGALHSVPGQNGNTRASQPLCLTYRQLDREAGILAGILVGKGVAPDSIVGLLAERSVEMILGIAGILKAGGAYLPMEPQSPEERKQYMLKDSGAKLLLTTRAFEKQVEKLKVETIFIEAFSRGAKTFDEDQYPRPVGDEISYMRPESGVGFAGLAYIIYTSGTTGKPKGILTMHYNVTRVVRNTGYIDLTSRDRVLQLSNYAFDGSVFDIYGALLNGAALVLAEKKKAAAVDKLADLIRSEMITVFFVTTALFNALADLKIECLANTRKVLFGGERVSEEHSKKALAYLGKDRVIHVYGPTETTVFATYHPIGHIEEKDITVPIGRPIANTSLFVLDKDLRPLPPGVQGELYIGGSGLARGYLNSPELTHEKFLRSFFQKATPRRGHHVAGDKAGGKKLYKTGDLVRWNFRGNIEFLGRADDQVKLRGFRIELGEIENRLLTHEDVKEAVVTITGSSGEKQICAYIAGKNAAGSSDLRQYLSHSLPEYMIPSSFTFLDRMPLTANGKIDRKALPEPAVRRAGVYVAPGDAVEKKMAAIWSKMLGIGEGEIGIDDDFFELGGHSLNAAVLLSGIHKIFDTEISITRFFENPTIRALTDYIKGTQGEQHRAIVPMEKKEYYALSSAQKRLYLIQQMEPESTNYNIFSALKLTGEPDKARMEHTLRAFIDRYESFRTSFEMIAGEAVQKIHAPRDIEFKIEPHMRGEAFSRGAKTFDEGHGSEVPSPGGVAVGRGGLAVPETINSFVRPFDLSRAPLLRICLIKAAAGEYIFLMDIHHIVFDGISMGIFFEELFSLYEGDTLPVLRIQYRDFSEWQTRNAADEREKERMKSREEYWLKEFSGEIPPLDIKTDYVRPRIRSFEGDTVFFEILPEETGQLKKLAEEEGATLFMILMALFYVLLFKLSGREDIVIGTFAAGRSHADVARIIGMFVVTLPLRNFPAGHKTFRELLKEIKQRTLKAFENQEYPYEELVEKVVKSRDTSRNPLYDVGIIWQNLDWLRGNTSQVEKRDFSISPFEYDSMTSKLDLFLKGSEIDKKITAAVEYCTSLFKRKTIDRFISYFSGIVSAVILDPDRQLGEIVKITTGRGQVLLDRFSEDLENE